MCYNENCYNFFALSSYRVIVYIYPILGFSLHYKFNNLLMFCTCSLILVALHKIKKWLVVCFREINGTS